MNQIRRYSEAFKRQVVKEYESGVSCFQLKEKYGIGGSSTVNQWVKKYSRNGLRHKLVRIQKVEEQDPVKELKAQVQALQEAVAQLTLEKMIAEKKLALYREEYGDSLVKKNGRPLSVTSTKGESSR